MGKSYRTKVSKKALIWAGLWVMFSFMLWGCEKKSHETGSGPPPVPASAAEVIRGDAPLTLSAIGEVKPYQSVTIKSRVTGHLLSIEFKNGTDVNKGDPLFTIDPVPFELALKEAQANLSRAKTQATEAQKEYARRRDLVAKGAVTKEAYDQKAAEAQALQEDASAFEAQQSIARQNLAYTQISSPLDGRAGKNLVDIGNLVIAENDALVVINQVQPITVRFSIPQEYLDEVKEYSAKDHLQVTVFIPSREAYPETGVLVFIDNTVNPVTGMIDLEATFENNNRYLWPGQFVEVELTLTVEKDAVQIPEKALEKGPQGYFVYQLQPDHTVKMTPVEKTRNHKGRVVIKSGLTGGETVITDGQLRLAPGSKVKILPSPDDSPEEKKTETSEPAPDNRPSE
jgi:membrane fusion protein, multidrug efflux system